MAGGSHHKGSSSSSSQKPSSSHRKPRWESTDKKPSAAGESRPLPPKPSSKPTPDRHQNPNPKPAGPALSPAFPNPPPDPSRSVLDPMHPGAPPPAYGFHMLDRRTIVLADSSVRSYFALPPDYQDFARQVLPRGPEVPGSGLGFDRRLGPMSPNFRDREFWNPENSLKRKYGDDVELARHRQQLLQYANAGLNPNGYPVNPGDRGELPAGTSAHFPRDGLDLGRGDEFRASKYMRLGGGGGDDHVGLKHNDVDQGALKRVFLHFVKLINENVNQKRNYLENGKQAPLQCVVCGRSSKEFPDMHSLIMHMYNPDKADLLVDHLGLHKALCVLMGWNYLKSPDNSKAYQLLPPDEAAANQDDLIMWPPMVIILNTNTGKGRDGRQEGLGNKAMDNKLRELGFGSGKAMSVYGREGHLGITTVKFAGDESGLKEAMRLAEFFEKESRGRKAWTRVQSLTSGIDDENNPNLVKVDEKTGEKQRIFYGYLGTAFDLDKLNYEMKKKVVIESRREYKSSK